MTLYTRKAGQFVKLDAAQVRKLRRTDQVIALQVTAGHLANRVRGHAAWLMGIMKSAQSRGDVLKLSPSDLEVARLPNIHQFQRLADEVSERIEELRKC